MFNQDKLNIPEIMAKSLGKLKLNHAFVSILVPKAEENGANLEPKTFFSTLENTGIPNDMSDLFLHLIEQLREEWNDLLEAAEKHLDESVSGH